MSFAGDLKTIVVATDLEGALERAPIVVLKPMLLGGLTNALRIARTSMKRAPVSPSRRGWGR